LTNSRIGCALRVVAAAVMIRATCDKSHGSAVASPAGQRTDGGTQVVAAPPPSPGEGQTPALGVEKSPEVVTGIPGMDFTTLPLPAQKELKQVLSDEFCYCGCPHSLGACLAEHRGCHHGRRMALLAAKLATGGAPAGEIGVMLSKYYLSFRERRQDLKVDAQMCTGAANAKVTLVEFSDFECPFCAAARPILANFMKENASKVRLCFSSFPLPAHPHAMLAAQAALYARDHGKFWPMHDALFDNQSELSDQTIRALAEKLGMSGVDLAKAIESRKLATEVLMQKQVGIEAGVDSTPGIFVNGRRLTLPLAPEVLNATLQDELEWINNRNAWAVD